MGQIRPILVGRRFFHRNCGLEYLRLSEEVDPDLSEAPDESFIDRHARARVFEDGAFEVKADFEEFREEGALRGGRRREVLPGFEDAAALTRALVCEAAIGLLSMERIPLHYETIAKIIMGADGSAAGSSRRRVFQLLMHDARVRYLGDGVFALSDSSGV